MSKIKELSLSFAADKAGARRLAGVMNQLLVDLALIEMIDKELKRQTSNWSDAFAGALDEGGKKTLVALAALGGKIPLDLLVAQIEGGQK